MFYISLGCVGYAAFGNGAPGNILTGFHEPFWLVDIANIGVIIHLIGAYQVECFFVYLQVAYYEYVPMLHVSSSLSGRLFALIYIYKNIVRSQLVTFVNLCSVMYHMQNL